MNFIDSIVEIIKTTPISNMDASYIKTMDPVKVFQEIEKRPGYKILLETMTLLYTDALTKGIDVKTASAVVLSTQEDMLRYVIIKAVRERLNMLAVEDVLKLDKEIQDQELTAKIEIAKKDLIKLEDSYKLYTDKLPINQFRYSLKYAAEKWGDKTDQLIVDQLIKKIKIEVIKK